MKKKYQINGISCGGCIASVKKTLEVHPNIERAQIFLEPKGAAIVTVSESLTVDELQEQLNTLKGYTITEFKETT